MRTRKALDAAAVVATKAERAAEANDPQFQANLAALREDYEAERAARTDLLGRQIAEPRAKPAAEPTIRNDPNQIAMPGMEASAVQAQAARDAQGRGALQSEIPQKPPNEGLFAPDTSGQGTLYSFPGALFDPEAWKRLFREQPGYEVLRDKNNFPAKVSGEIRAALAPTSLRGAKPMEYAIRQRNAAVAQSQDMAFHALQQVRDAVDRLPREAQIDFTDKFEHGEKQATPALQATADTLRSILDDWTKKIQSLGKGYLAHPIENYAGHIWGNWKEWSARQEPLFSQAEMEQQARWAATGQKRPLTGTGNFLKKRSFPTQLEGIQAGLEPVTYNPVDLQLIKINEMQKFYHGVQLADRIKDEGLAKWVPATQDAEAVARNEGWVKLDDRIFQPRLMGDANKAGFGRLDAGSYWAPEPLARVFNNFMSQGWSGQSSIYDAFRRSNNALNGLQLFWPGFHATFVTMDTMTSKLALALQQAASGHPIRAVGTAAQTPIALPQALRRGSALAKEWVEPGSTTPEVANIVNALKAGGGRMSMPEFFKTSNSGAFFRTLSDLKNPLSPLYQAAQMYRDAPGVYGKTVGLALKMVGRAMDQVMHPVMGYLVPRVKLGVFSDMAQNWLRDHPNASPEEVSAAMTQIVDSVDNRLGQLNYDNLFWNKTLKDLAFVTTRSVGWNLGTVREIGGGLADLASLPRHGRFTERMAYTVAMPILTGTVGAIMTYLATGQGPQSMLDYFYPPTGGSDENGVQERRSIPGYMKDVIAFSKDPQQTVLNKMSPLLATANEVRQGKDYYGRMIYNPLRDQSMTRAYLDYLLNQAAPFTLRALQKQQEEGLSPMDQALAAWGFQPAPKSITQPERSEMFRLREQRKDMRRRPIPGQIHYFNAPQPES